MRLLICVELILNRQTKIILEGSYSSSANFYILWLVDQVCCRVVSRVRARLSLNQLDTKYTFVKNKWILCTEKPVSKASFQDFWCPNINNHLICLVKTLNTYLKAKNSLHTTHISSFKYVFIVCFEKIQIYIVFISAILYISLT